MPAQSLYHWRRRLRGVDGNGGGGGSQPPRLVRLEPVGAGGGSKSEAKLATAELGTSDRVMVPVVHLPELLAALREAAVGDAR